MAPGVAGRLLAGASKAHRLKRLRQRIAIEHPLDFNRTFDSLTFVAGTGRSGTTWLVDLLNADNRHRVIFEPLRSKWGALNGFDLPTYIRPDCEDPHLVGLVRNILLGNFKSNRWTGRGNERIVSTRRIVKDVHSNLRLAWLRAQFPRFPIILIIRHPCAIAASRQRLGDDTSLDGFLEDAVLVEDHLDPFLDELRRLDSPFERQIARWCIETYVPLRQFGTRHEIALVFYEHLVGNPRSTLEDLFRMLGREAPAAAYEKVGKPSLTTYRPDEPLASAADAVTDWRKQLGSQQVERALELLALFGLDRLYGSQPEPRLSDGRLLLELYAVPQNPQDPQDVTPT